MQIPPGLDEEESAVFVAWKARVPGPRIVENFLVKWLEDLFVRRVSMMFRMSMWCSCIKSASMGTLSFWVWRELILMVATLRFELVGVGGGTGDGKVVVRKVEAIFFRTALECMGVSDSIEICCLDLES
jgi:hypothetical protein